MGFRGRAADMSEPIQVIVTSNETSISYRARTRHHMLMTFKPIQSKSHIPKIPSSSKNTKLHMILFKKGCMISTAYMNYYRDHVMYFVAIRFDYSFKTTSMEDVSTCMSTWKNKEFLRTKHKAKKYMMCQGIYNCICQNKKKWRYTIYYVKPTAQLLFKNRFPKGGPTCRRQVVNPRHQTSQGQPVAKPETPLHNIQVE